jgi:hypothetical protein
MKKKSQLQSGESIAIVIIVILLIIIGIVFWNKLKMQDIKELKRVQEEMNTIELAKITSELPELRCYTSEATTKVNCFDWYKLLAFNKTMNDPATHDRMMLFYNGYFGNSRITIQQLYPDEVNITLYSFNITSQTTQLISIPIIIEKNNERNPIRTFGYILVEGYYR